MSSNDSGGEGPSELTDVAGIGEARADELREAGIESVADLRAADEDELADVLGAGVASRIVSDLEGEDAEDESADAGAAAAADDEGGADEASPDADADEEDTEADAADESDGDDAAEEAPSDDAAADTESDVAPEDQPGGSTGIGTVEEPPTADPEKDSSGTDPMIAALASFIIPGLGQYLAGQSDRALALGGVWAIWVVLGWIIGFWVLGGIVFSVIAAFTFGIGWLIWLLVGLFMAAIELFIHGVAAFDAYAQSDLVDRLEETTEDLRD